MNPDPRILVRPRHMALAAVVVAVGLLIVGAVDADAAPAVEHARSSLPSPMLILPVMLAFALRTRD